MSPSNAPKRPAKDIDDHDTKRHHTGPDPSASTSTTFPKSLAYPPTSRPATRSVPFQQPFPILTFSYTPDHELEFTNSAMRYYVDAPRNADLGHGYDRWVRRPDERGRLDSLLTAYSKVLGEPPPAAGNLSAGVISWRGVMTRILTAPYEERDGWELNVMLVDGTLYLEEHSSDAALQKKNNMEPRHRLQSYYGYAFESWSTTSEPGGPSGWGGDVNTNVQWCSVVKTKLGNTRIVIGGEVDCVRGSYDERNDRMVELKTSMNIRNPQDEARFEKKLLKFYIQSFLLGVPEIVVGFRTSRGQLSTLQSFKTMHIPRMVRGKPGAWDPQICLEWGDKFLTWLRQTIDASNKPSNEVWRVTFTPRSGVTVELLDEARGEDVEYGGNRVGFLPRWYWKEAEERASEGTPLRPPPESRNEVTSAPMPTVPSGWQL